MTTTENVTELMSHMSDQELADGIENAKAGLAVPQRRRDAEAIFSAGVLLVAELRRRMSV